TSLGIGVFSHMMKMDDAMLGLIACSSKIVASLFYAFAKTSTQFYLASLIDMVGGTAVIAMRSIASKLVPSEELGKINSLFGVCEAVVPLIYQPLYSFVYQKTLNTLPGAFFLVGSSLTSPTVFIFLYLYYLDKKQPLNTAMLNKEDSPEIKTNEGFDMSEETLEVPVNTKL
ncbi:probable peptidoglycan muropeptide transporter SLC46, partial [Halyomorpha halys]